MPARLERSWILRFAARALLTVAPAFAAAQTQTIATDLTAQNRLPIAVGTAASQSFALPFAQSAGAPSSSASTLTSRPVAKFSRVASRADVNIDERSGGGFFATPLQPRSTAPAPWYAPLASLVVPGTGQALLKQQRSVAYFVAEGFMVLRAVRAHHDQNSAKLQYQKLAADVARSGFGTDKPTGPWDYYEILEHYPASGAFDLNVAGKFTPETDVSTYNGEVWFNARQIFWDSPDAPPPESSSQYARALARYKDLAMQGSYRFSWKDQSNVQNEYILSIADANRSRQQVVSTFGLLAANHLASMVDAYINVRLRRYGGAGLVGASIKTEVRPSGASTDQTYGAAMTFSVPVSLGNRIR